MHIDMAVVSVLLSAILGCLVAFPIWVVKSFNEFAEKAATKLELSNQAAALCLEKANQALNQRLSAVQIELENGRVVRHEQAARIIALADTLNRLVNEFEKMRDKLQEHIENSDCRKR